MLRHRPAEAQETFVFGCEVVAHEERVLAFDAGERAFDLLAVAEEDAYVANAFEAFALTLVVQSAHADRLLLLSGQSNELSVENVKVIELLADESHRSRSGSASRWPTREVYSSSSS